MQTTGVNRACGWLAVTTGLLLILVANAAGADPLVADAATATASRPLLADAAATEVDLPVSSSSVSAAKDCVSTGDNPVRPVDEQGTFPGQLVMQYLDSFN